MENSPNEKSPAENKIVEPIEVDNNKGSAASLNIDKQEGAEPALKNEDSEVVITTNQFNKIIESIFMKIAEYLLTNKQTARSHFKDIIYSHELNNEVYEAIPLKYLMDELEKIDIKIDTIGIHCLYEKLKYSDEFESIDVGKLVEELENYGIFENTITQNNPIPSARLENAEDLYQDLNSYLLEKKLQVAELFKDHIGISENGEMLIKVKDFEDSLTEKNITRGKTLSKYIIREITKEDDNNYIDVTKLKLKLSSLQSSEPIKNEQVINNNVVEKQEEIIPDKAGEVSNDKIQLPQEKSKHSKKSKDKKENNEVIFLLHRLTFQMKFLKQIQNYSMKH